MPNPPRVVFVDVFINSIAPKLDFDVVPSPKNNPQLPIGTDGSIIFSNDDHDGFWIHFELQGNTFGYFFPPHNQRHDALWSQRGTVCPDQSGIWEIFHPLRVVDPPNPPPGFERRTLIARNRNPGPKPGQGLFQYNLRVTNGTDWKDLDPGGNNQNGQVKKFDWNYALIGLSSGAVAGVAATLLIAGATPPSILRSAAAGALVGVIAALIVALIVGSLGNRAPTSEPPA